MKVLVILNYYFPYVSGLSEYARLLCEELAKCGNEVTVLTSNHDKLPEEEFLNGVRVVRAPIWFKISKGVISPRFILWAAKYAKLADVVQMHLPMLEAGVISLLVKSSQLICTYHCDVNLPDGFINRIITKIMDLSHKVALRRARCVVVNTIEYMHSSRVAAKYMDKMKEISPPIKKLPVVDRPHHDKFRIGFCGRIVEEKGIDVLIKAFALLQKERENIVLVIGGDYKAVAGGSVYPRLKQYIDAHHIENVRFLGKIPEEKMSDFYAAMDVFVLPSINSLESFGMVQVEAMVCGTPVIASDLPGVRTVVQNTGMGLICKRGSAEDLKDCFAQIMDNHTLYYRSREVIEKRYGISNCVGRYMKIMKKVGRHEI